ncbi:MAG TPA: hypothetical protein VKV37_03215 [Ktedonobacteraceae bacterium]|nr:hypothetical protein [Ktedonobacteraceae bacterium]
MGSRNSIPHRDSGPYEYYPLDVREIALIPDEHEIVVNPKNGLALLVDWDLREVRADSQFEPEACKVIMKLLNDWPAFVPYEKLLPLISHEAPAQIAERIEAARFADTLEQVIAPLVTILDQCKPTLARLGLAIYPMLEHGYLLISCNDTSQWNGQDEGKGTASADDL